MTKKQENAKINVSIVFPQPSEDAISQMLRDLTREIDARGLGEIGVGLLGGFYGYGCNYENDVFLMHRYCWCEERGCPWCGGCSGTGRKEPHREACYSTRLDALRKRHGAKSMLNENSAYARSRTALCVEMGLDPEYGCEVHCTCDRMKRFDACECDYHQGRGQFRFGRATEAPNFWHKPTGLRVHWYKYIGRDMKASMEIGQERVQQIFASCLASLGS